MTTLRHNPLDVAALERIARRSPRADPQKLLPEVPPHRLPRHVAIIMDGNGRWAHARGFPREFGHRNGARTVRLITEEAVALGLDVLTLYSFSLENWKRPAEEVAALMDLCKAYLEGERDHLVRENIRFCVIGRREGLPAEILRTIDATQAATAGCTGLTLCLAINYGGRAEIADAVRAIAERVARGEIAASRVDEAMVAAHLSTACLGDAAEPDLLIRTAGEMRISNFLLWQISYAELHVSPVLWPDFTGEDLRAAIRDFAGRNRKFGGLSSSTPS